MLCYIAESNDVAAYDPFFLSLVIVDEVKSIAIPRLHVFWKYGIRPINW